MLQDQIFSNIIKRKISSSGLLTGEMGRLVMLCHYSSIKRNEELNAECLMLVENFEMNFITNLNSSYYANGLVGILSGLKIIEELDIEYKFSFDIIDVSKQFIEIIKKDLSHNNYDFFNGAVGLIQFFILMNDKKNLYKSIEKLLKYKEVINNGFYWPCYNRRTFDSDYINLGMAHGMAAIIAILHRE